MSEPGWYVDYEDPNRMRYHDGNAWTEHVHSPSVADSASPGDAAPATSPTDGAAVPENAIPQHSAAADATKDGPLVKVLSFSVIGLLVGFMFGAFLFNGLGAITPTTETTGTVERLDIEFSRSSGSSNRRSYIVLGTTVDGDDWRIVDEDAYNVLQAEGYPQPVSLAMGDWTGTPERVTGRSFVVDHQTTGARVGWAVVIGLVGLGSIVAAFFIARSKSGGPLGAIVFLVSTLGLGAWLGYQGVQWIQSG